MDDSKFGSRDKRGDWKPFKLSSNIPFFDWPFSITKNLKLNLARRGDRRGRHTCIENRNLRYNVLAADRDPFSKL